MSSPKKETAAVTNSGKRSPADKDKEIETILSSHRTKIRVVGCGGAGNNTLSRLLDTGIADVEAIAVNTDAQDLLYAQADHKILIGKNITNGLGAGSNPEIGEKAAQENSDEISHLLDGADLVFVTCGLGGGTGTGSAPVVSQIARERGALTIAVVSLPFTEEGVMRWENAHRGLENLRENTDTVIVVQNDRLLEIAPDMPLNQAFKVADEILANAVKGITELVTEKGLVNLDFADIRAVMKDGGTAMIGLGESASEDKAIEAVDMAVQNPLLDVDITGAKSALINITGGNDMSLKDARIIMKSVAEKLDPAARVIWGARMDADMESSLRVMLIVTGLRGDSSLGHSGTRAAVQYQTRDDGVGLETTNSDSQDSENWSGKEAAPVQANTSISQPVYNKVFKEETDTDIDMLQNATSALRTEVNSHTPLRDIKNAAASLGNAAQIFSHRQIADLADAVEMLASHLLTGEIRLTEERIETLQFAGTLFRGMVYGDSDALAEAERSTVAIHQLLDARIPGHRHLENQTVLPPEPETSDLETEADIKEINDALPFDEMTSKKGKVGEMVNYVRSLLGEDRAEED